MTASKPPTWYVYVLECVDGSLYTGIAIDVARRYASHAVGKGGRYLLLVLGLKGVLSFGA